MSQYTGGHLPGVEWDTLLWYLFVSYIPHITVIQNNIIRHSYYHLLSTTDKSYTASSVLYVINFIFVKLSG